MRFLLILLLILVSSFVFAQDRCGHPQSADSLAVIRDSTIIAGMVVYLNPDEPAQFVGGSDTLRKYIRNNLNYKLMDIHENDQKVFLRFIVLKDGSIANIKIMRGAYDYPEFDAEAIRVVKSMPNWIPAKVNGQPVNSYFNLPVRFCH